MWSGWVFKGYYEILVKLRNIFSYSLAFNAIISLFLLSG